MKESFQAIPSKPQFLHHLSCSEEFYWSFLREKSTGFGFHIGLQCTSRNRNSRAIHTLLDFAELNQLPTPHSLTPTESKAKLFLLW